ncbi:CHAT domain-containing protein [Mycena capillaripes]|nr:CHAT domain-containing protein [Mycena capillaripes]
MPSAPGIASEDDNLVPAKNSKKTSTVGAGNTGVSFSGAPVTTNLEMDGQIRADTFNLGRGLLWKYRESWNLQDLEASVENFHTALDLAPPGHPDRARRLQGLAVSLGDRYRRLGDLKDLEAALNTSQEVVDLTPPGHPDIAARLLGLAGSLTHRYQRFGDLEDLVAALQRKKEIVHLTPPQNPNRAGRLQSLAVALTDRYRRLGDLKDLEAAQKTFQEAVDLTPPGHPDQARQLQGLAVSLVDRYRRLGDLEDLEAALKTSQEVVDLTPSGHPDAAARLKSLAMPLADRYQKLGDLKDLDAAIKRFQEAVDLTPPGHTDQGGRLQGLAASLTDRYRRFGDLKDLEAALQQKKQAVHLTPIGHPDRAQRLQSLAVSLTDRYRRLGDLKDLEAVLKRSQEAVDLTPPSHPDQAFGLQGLAVPLMERYRKLGDPKDLEAARERHQEAVDLTPPGQPDRADQLQGLAVSLTHRYQRFGDLKDLEVALQSKKESVHLTPPQNPNLAGRLQSLAVSLTHRYRRLGDLKDLEAAVQKKKDAVDLTPIGHPNRAEHLRGLAVSLTNRYQRLGDLKDLEAALKRSQEAVDLTPPGHPDLAFRLQCLGVPLMERYRRLGDPMDLQAIHNHYTASFKIPSFIPEDSWDQALHWADFAKEFQTSDCIPAFQAAFNLLPEILWIGHSIPVHHDAILRLCLPDATSRAIETCITLVDLHAAVELLEQGLATIFQQMLQLKTDVDLLPPDQAENFVNLSSQLYSGTFSNPIDIVEDRKKLLQDIRTQSGFKYFLLPKSYNVLCHASQGGPVIILTSHKDHCDAIIILSPTSEPVHVPLPTVRLEQLKSQREMLKELLDRCNVRNRGQSLSSRLFGQREGFSSKSTQECFEEMLTWLWTDVCGISNGRLWWLPTGEFTRLPLHASPPSDEFIHSYTTTLGSLLDAYAKIPSTTAPKLAVVGVTHTDSKGSNSLKGVVQEVNKIISIIKEPYIQCSIGEQARVDAVRAQLQDCSWVHLACHGHQNLRDPAKSHLLLYEGNLELETILRMPLPNAQFVFLAACQTAMGDAELVNESFHLSGGFITAGFRSAIGTMWSMNDEDGPTVAGIVYSHLFRDGRPRASDASEALSLAVKELRNRKIPYERWIPFIHIGI